MTHEHIIRAWKDAEFRNSLSEKERELLPEHPVGVVELTDVELDGATGGRPLSYGGCPNSTECTHLQGCTNIWMCSYD